MARLQPGQRRHAVWGAILFQLAVAIYGGYFGAGIGILMLASLGFLGLSNIHEMNTLKTILGSLINVVAAVWFIWKGLIHWPKAGVMTAGALLGYFLGSHFAQRIPQQRVRQLITLIGFIISGGNLLQTIPALNNAAWAAGICAANRQHLHLLHPGLGFGRQFCRLTMTKLSLDVYEDSCFPAAASPPFAWPYTPSRPRSPR